MSRTIHLDLEPNSITAALKQLRAYQRDLEKIKKRILQRIVTEAIEVAQATYGASVSVTSVDIGEGMRYEIVASGKAVCFLEFGAGIRTDSGHPFSTKVPFEVSSGSWSREHSGQFVAKGYWVFGGRKYEYVSPKKGMWEAYKFIRENVLRIAQEEFGR